VVGIDNVPATGPAVITWNHHSYVDFLMLGLAVVDGRGRAIRVLGKSEIWENPVLAWIADHARAVPVYRGERGGGGALTAAVDALRSGDLVVVAPEQTISESFELLPFAHGAAIMATAAGVPVVPSVGWGSHRFATKGHTLNLDQALGLPVTTRFGPPLHPEPGESPEAFTVRIQDATADLLREVQAAYPDRPDPGEHPWWLPARLGGSAPPHEQVLAAHTARMQARRRRQVAAPHDQR
jgi:1-acyl-sn-glycerol-3-phosphate acyltransferase